MAKSSTTSMAVAGTGALVTGIGRMVGGRMGAWISGFGLAHIALGLLDLTRPTIRNNS
ncbi:MAG: hypothetical protein SCK29_07000 [Bacillota bacterium]|nr:hypothetical protein [Bacillota bacterium]MDW7683852.1 hypothetical protein [Bacillota bacterium]